MNISTETYVWSSLCYRTTLPAISAKDSIASFAALPGRQRVPHRCERRSLRGTCCVATGGRAPEEAEGAGANMVWDSGACCGCQEGARGTGAGWAAGAAAGCQAACAGAAGGAAVGAA